MYRGFPKIPVVWPKRDHTNKIRQLSRDIASDLRLKTWPKSMPSVTLWRRSQQGPPSMHTYIFGHTICDRIKRAPTPRIFNNSPKFHLKIRSFFVFSFQKFWLSPWLIHHCWKDYNATLRQPIEEKARVFFSKERQKSSWWNPDLLILPP